MQIASRRGYDIDSRAILHARCWRAKERKFQGQIRSFPFALASPIKTTDFGSLNLQILVQWKCIVQTRLFCASIVPFVYCNGCGNLSCYELSLLCNCWNLLLGFLQVIRFLGFVSSYIFFKTILNHIIFSANGNFDHWIEAAMIFNFGYTFSSLTLLIIKLFIQMTPVGTLGP